MNVKKLAEKLGVTADTVRYYTRIGYVNPRKNPDNGYKEYTDKDRRRLQFILGARQLGFSVEDVGLILGKADKGRVPCPLVRELLEKRLAETEKQFIETLNLRKRMKSAIKRWQDQPDQLPTGTQICHLIEEFDFG